MLWAIRAQMARKAACYRSIIAQTLLLRASINNAALRNCNYVQYKCRAKPRQVESVLPKNALFNGSRKNAPSAVE